MLDGSDTEQADLFGESWVVMPPRIDRAQLAASLAKVVSPMTLDQVVSIITNPYDELLEYIALNEGQRSCQRTSLLFNPHRLDTPTSSSSESVYAALRRPEFSHGLARATLFKQTRVSQLFYRCIELGINGVQYVNEFPPYVARDLCIRYGVTRSSHVIDPCAGWGGRMIGCSTVTDSYTGFEPSSRTAEGLLRLFEFITTVRPEFHADVHCVPFEDSAELPDHYDFALTSPPYYDTERYSDEDTNSCNRYRTFDDWCDGFYLPLVDKTMRQLKDGAVFILNIGDRKYPLSDVLRDHSIGRYSIRVRGNKLSGNGGLGKENSSGEQFYEVTNL